MLELIIAILISLGFNVESESSFSLDNKTIDIIKQSEQYKDAGGDEALANYVTVTEPVNDGIVVTDDDNPSR
jgi:hypothetical protein